MTTDSKTWDRLTLKQRTAVAGITGHLRAAAAYEGNIYRHLHRDYLAELVEAFDPPFDCGVEVTER